VQRNRCKRRFRELLRVSRHRLHAGWDLLVLPKRDSIDVPAPDLRLAWNTTFVRAGLFHN
jgi:ribonuclease P protein component